MKTEFIQQCIKGITQAIIDHENDIESLDRAIGDGDHYINLKRGCLAINSMTNDFNAMPSSEIFKKIGMKLLSTIGGASGPLFASFFLELSKSLENNGDDRNGFTKGFASGVQAIMARGKSDFGEKTMLDVLIPVSELLNNLVDGDIFDVATQIDRKAHEAMLATKDLLPTKGRSAGLGDRALGHIDPGAKSCQVMISAVCQEILKGKK